MSRSLIALLGWIASAQGFAQCIPAGQWWNPATHQPIAAEALWQAAAPRAAVLLGETHDKAAHHRWQFAVLQALHQRRPQLVLALEMLPRSAQPALDDWLRGELDDAQFLERSRWNEVWGVSPEFYLPVLRYARDNRLPIRALNVERSLTRRVAQEGFGAVPMEERQGLPVPAAPSPEYVAALREVHAQHRRDAMDEAALQRFVEAQLVWDAAMAQGIVETRRRWPDAQVVALIGQGHLRYGHGVPHQLRALDGPSAMVLLPWDDCTMPPPDIADAVYGLTE